MTTTHGDPQTPEQWWDNSVFLQVYVRSFADNSGDGIGDLEGLISRLGYLELLGVSGLWLSPIMVSPMADHGYDVANPRDIDPLFGNLDIFDHLIAEAHARELRILLDLVPNHTSIAHPWFQSALNAAPGSPERNRYWFREGKGVNGELPPNNWTSIFGGPAWTRVQESDGSAGQWYLHLFSESQPDLNWNDPSVRDDLVTTLRFWLDRGVDGFRIDAAHGLVKPANLPNTPPLMSTSSFVDDNNDPRFDNDAVHDIHRLIRTTLDEYEDVVSVGEVWVRNPERFSRYIRPDELHLAFHFGLLKAEFNAEAIEASIREGMKAAAGSLPTWTLSNHDTIRPVTRYSDGAAGLERARAMLLVELALPGVVFLYNGEELGLPSVMDLPESALQDPIWERSHHEKRGRDDCRVPLPWEGINPPFGFSSNPETWLPLPQEWTYLTVEAQLEDIGSTLSLVRQALELRAGLPEASGNDIEWYGAPEGCLAFRRTGGLICALNAGKEPLPLPQGKVVLTSSPLEQGMLPPDAAAWLTPMTD